MYNTEIVLDAAHHMVNACIAGDVTDLLEEFDSIPKTFSYENASAEEMDKLYEVSLTAGMEGALTCLSTLYSLGFPLHELTPVIAACHGHCDVIEFCERIGLGNCVEAWSRYTTWLMCQPQEESEMLMTASEWMTAYYADTRKTCCA